MVGKMDSSDSRPRVSGERAGRLYRILTLLAESPVPRMVLLKKVKVGTRTLFRDLDLLRACGIPIETTSEGYRLAGKLDQALFLLPFPDPEIAFGDVLVLIKGRSKTHKRLRQLFESLTA